MTRVRWILFIIAASFAISGFTEPLLPNYDSVYNVISIPHTFFLAVLYYAWCREDAAARGIQPPRWVPLTVALFAPIGVPLYFFKTMPWRQASLYTLAAVGFLLLVFVIYTAAFELGMQVWRHQSSW